MTTQTLEATTRDLLRQAWRSQGRHELECTCLDLVPEFVQLVRESHDQPASHLAAAVKQRLLEQRSCAAHLLDPPSDGDQDAQVDRIVEVLEQVRQRGCAEGVWSDAPMPELMCG